MPERIKLVPPERFNFRSAVYSHGWYDLAPFSLDLENWRLSYVASLSGAPPGEITISEADGMVVIESESAIDDHDKLRSMVGHLLRFDEDFDDFYRKTNRSGRLAWIADTNAGRLLRSATVWEDLVKTICTTNCSWAMTRIMVGNLVEQLGRETVSGRRAFPDAEAMASMPEAFYRDEIRAGYRSGYFVELAKLVAGGELDPEAWLASGLETKDLKKLMKSVKGVGDYAAENLLKLVGRYDGLALDSWLRARFYEKHTSGKACDDREIELFYEKFGRWKGLAIWCDMAGYRC